MDNNEGRMTNAERMPKTKCQTGDGSPAALDRLEPVAKVLVLHICRKLCRSLGRKMHDPTKAATKAADKVFSSADFCNSPAALQYHRRLRPAWRAGKAGTCPRSPKPRRTLDCGDTTPLLLHVAQA